MTRYRWPVTALLLIPLLAAAQGDRSTVEVTLDAEIVNVGDPVKAIVTVTHPPDLEVVWPDPPIVAPFELLDWQVQASTADENESHSRLELTVAAFELGDLSLPTFDIQVVDSGGAVVTLTTDTASVTVASIGRDAGGDIRDIRGPLSIPFELLTLLPWLTGFAAMVALGYWLYRRNRRRAKPPGVKPIAPPRPAHLVALESLDALEVSGLLERGEVKPYHIRLSDIIRVYIWSRFGIQAMERTTSEVLTELRRTDTPKTVATDFGQLLDRCDLVKFAKFRPEAATCHELVPLSRRLVDLTTTVEPMPTRATTKAKVPDRQSAASTQEPSEQAEVTSVDEERLNLDTHVT